MSRFPTLRPLARALIALCCTPALAATLPTGLQVQQGQAQLQQQGNQLTVRNSPNAILNWQSFSIGAGAGVYFEQASAASKVLNRVVGSDPSQILGSLGSNGQVWLLNPHGVLFGAGARVDVASLVTSTLNLSDADFIGGRYRFSADTGATVRNEGELRGSLGGQIVLLGGRVENAGTVEAGQVLLAAARQVELVDSGAPNLAVRVEVPAGEVLNLGRLSAPGGRIDVHAASVNQQGLVQADSLGTDAQGRVVLQASQRLTLAADSVTAAAGGEIQLLGQEVALLDGSRVDASAPTGGGRIWVGGGAGGRDAALPNARAVYMGPQAELRADATAQGDGGSIWLWSDAATRAYGRFSAQGGPAGGSGGFVETSGGWLDARPSLLALQAPLGRGGQWLIDPNDLTICQSGCNVHISGGPNFTTTEDNAFIDVATLTSALNAGTSVTLATATGGANAQSGTIRADAITLNLSPATPVSLTLKSHADILLSNSTLRSGGAALTLNLDAGGGIHLDRMNVNTAGGDIVFGSLRSICTALQGCSDLVSTTGGPGSFAGLRIDASTLRAGNGRIFGGGSSLGSTTATRIADSTLQARDIALNARAEGSAAIELAQNVILESSHRLLLDGRTDSGANGLAVGPGSRLNVRDPAQAADALMHLQGHNLSTSGGNGLLLIGGTAGAPSETYIRVEGAAMTLEGHTNTQGSNLGVGLYAFGDANQRGLTLDAQAALPGSTVTLTGTNNRNISDGHAYLITYARVLGPDSAGALEILGTGGRNTGLVGSLIKDAEISTRAPFLLRSDGIYLNNVDILGGGNLLLQSRNGPSDTAGAMVYALDSALSTDGAGAQIRIEGSDGAALRGGGQGAGIDLDHSTLTASGAGTAIRLQGRGGSLGAGGDGISMFGSTLEAASINLNGLGEGSGGGDGLRIRGSTLRASQLDLTGRVDNAAQFTVNAGINIRESSSLVLNGRSAATLDGDSVAFLNSQVDGAPTRFEINSTGSIAVRFSDLDFSSGPGTAVTFKSDSDSNLRGRVRIDFTTIKTGGGNLLVTGGSGLAAGLPSFDAENNPISNNTAVSEGASGILLQGSTIEAGAGSVTLQGRGPQDVVVRPDAGGAWGVLATGGSATDIRAARIVIDAQGGSIGRGLVVDASPESSSQGTELNLTAAEIAITGRGSGNDPATGRPFPGVHIDRSSSTWAATGALSVQAPSGGIRLQQGTLSGATLSLGTAAELSLGQVSLSASGGALQAQSGTGDGGSLLVTDSTLSASTRIGLSGNAWVAAPQANGVRLTGATRLQAPQIEINGTGQNAAGVRLQGMGGVLDASQQLSLTGRHRGGDSVGVSISDNWQLRAGQDIVLDTDRGLAVALDRASDSSPMPTATAARLLAIQISNAPNTVLSPTDLTGLNHLFSNMPAVAMTRVLVSGNPRAINSLLVTPSRLHIGIDDYTLLPGAQIRSGASGDAIVLTGSDGVSPMTHFTNQAGADALQTPNGRWLAFLDQGSTSSLGALTPSFTQYSVTPAGLSRDASGNFVVTAQGSGAFYRSGSPSTSASVAPAALSTQVALGTALTQASPAVQLSTPSEGRTLDALPGVAQGSGGASFTAVDSSQMTRAELVTLLAARDNYKKKVFADTLHQLQLDPALADVRPCLNEAELSTGRCLITEALKAEIQAARAAAQAPKVSAAAPAAATAARKPARKVKQASLPNIARKQALLIGINQYADGRIPDLQSAVPDAQAVRTLLEDGLGYETQVLQDASKESIVRALNQIALDSDANDSVMIYYAGHGEVVPANAMGYWLPADAKADEPQSWLSNADIARLIALIGARQTLLISDSCYSGTLAGSDKISVDGQAKAEDLLSRKAVVIMASGGNEPVADTGKNGHSVFAWHLMQRLQDLPDWQIGGKVFERIRFAVAREFPQTPQYGAARSAGHQGNTDYLFEKRSLEK